MHPHRSSALGYAYASAASAAHSRVYGACAAEAAASETSGLSVGGCPERWADFRPYPVSCSLSSERGRVSLTLFQLSFTSRARQKRKGSILRNELRWNHARRAVPVVPHMGYAPRTQRLFPRTVFRFSPHTSAWKRFPFTYGTLPSCGARWASNGENAMWRLVGIERANRLCGWTFILHAPEPRPVNDMFAAEDRRTAQRRSATVPAEP